MLLSTEIYSISPANMLACICTLGYSAGVKQTGMDVRDIVKVYVGCVGVRPDDIHIPGGGVKEQFKKHR